LRFATYVVRREIVLITEIQTIPRLPKQSGRLPGVRHRRQESRHVGHFLQCADAIEVRVGAALDSDLYGAEELAP
jgi:hypothetical protein